jgi:hypothetical protein
MGEDRTLCCRHEIKYLVADSVAAGVENWIRPRMALDEHSAARADGYYPIVSLYLDSPDLKLYRQSAEGVAVRFKLRVRAYSDEAEAPRFLEIKQRSYAIVTKRRARTTIDGLEQLLQGSGPGGDANDRETRGFQLHRAGVGANPVALVRYSRKAYEARGSHRLRITFDREVGYAPWSRPSVVVDGPRWQRLPLGRVVLEIKFTGRYPVWLETLVRRFDLVSRSVSKYGLSLEHAGLVRHLAPRRVG